MKIEKLEHLSLIFCSHKRIKQFKLILGNNVMKLI